jgi:signal transduction histidine kinase
MPTDKSDRPRPEELHAVLLQEVQALRGGLSRLEQLEQQRHHAEETFRQEEQRRHEQDKLEVVGRLAGGIAHHFNNLLTVILGHVDLLLSNLQPDSLSWGSAEAIKGAGEQAASLVRQLLTFSRQPPALPVLVDLNNILTSMAPALRRLLGRSIELTCALSSGPAVLRADPGQLCGLLLALAENARDAMPQGGRLRIQTSSASTDQEPAPGQGGLQPGRVWVILEVSDSGHGMDEATRARLFEPFFTTKEVGEGHGLGLATVWWIVRQGGGHIEVHSQPGQGATFKIYLPQGEGDAGGGAVG